MVQVGWGERAQACVVVGKYSVSGTMWAESHRRCRRAWPMKILFCLAAFLVVERPQALTCLDSSPDIEQGKGKSQAK